MKLRVWAMTMLCLFVCLPSIALSESTDAQPDWQVSGNFRYELNDDRAILHQYDGDQVVVSLPTEVDGYPVIGIGEAWHNNSLSALFIEAYAVDDGHPAFSVLDGVLFDKNGQTLLHYPAGRKQEQYSVPDGVEFIHPYAFAYAEVKRLSLPDSVREIGDRAFQDALLSQIRLPKGLVSIGDEALGGCMFLERLEIPQSVTHMGSLSLSPDFKELKIAAGNTALLVQNGALINQLEQTLIRYLPYATGTEYTIPAGITTIADFAFIASKTLQRITVPDSMLSIGDYAFAYCSSLREVNLPEGLVSIGKRAFSDVYGIKYLEIPQSVTSIGSLAFFSSASLTPLVYEGSYAEQYMREYAAKQSRRYAVFPAPQDEP